MVDTAMVDAAMMAPAWLLAAAAVASFVGMAWLALAMDVHWNQVHAQAAAKPGTRRMLRLLGVLALFVSLGLCLLADRPSMAVLVWVMNLAAASTAVAFTLAYRPRWLRWVALRG